MLSDDLLRTMPDHAWKLAADYTLTTATRHDARRFILATAVAAAYRELTDALYAEAKSYTEQGDALRENVDDELRCPAIGDSGQRCVYPIGHAVAHGYDFVRPMGVVQAEAVRHPLDHAAVPDPNDA